MRTQKKSKPRATEIGISKNKKKNRKIWHKASSPGQIAGGVTCLPLGIFILKSIFPLKVATTLPSGPRKGAVGAL